MGNEDLKCAPSAVNPKQKLSHKSLGCVVFILFNLCLIKLVGVTFIHEFISKLGPSSFECVVAIFTHGKTVFLVSRLNCI